ncbi:MAG: cation diffusion facilitator family transporter [Bacteroidetes bacterium]|nr:cation diffusion facilitator family transporter [Bacteroidota bacterium]
MKDRPRVIARSKSETPVLYSIFLNGIITLVELIGGMFSNSLALVSDAMHNFSDFVALIITLVAMRVMKWDGNTRKSYGYFRVEILAAFINSVLLVLIGVYLIYEAIGRFYHPTTINSEIMLGVASIGFAANFVSVLALRKHKEESLNLKSAFLHLLTDTLESGAVIVTAILISFYHITSLDLIVSIAIGIFIIKSSWDLLLESTNILTEGSPKGIDLNEVADYIKGFPGIKGVHHLHIWSLSSNFRALSAHIVVDDMQISRTVEITEVLEDRLFDKFKIDHPTFQLEADACEDNLIAQYRDRNGYRKSADDKKLKDDAGRASH